MIKFTKSLILALKFQTSSFQVSLRCITHPSKRCMHLHNQQISYDIPPPRTERENYLLDKGNRCFCGLLLCVLNTNGDCFVENKREKNIYIYLQSAIARNHSTMDFVIFPISKGLRNSTLIGNVGNILKANPKPHNREIVTAMWSLNDVINAR